MTIEEALIYAETLGHLVVRIVARPSFNDWQVNTDNGHEFRIGMGASIVEAILNTVEAPFFSSKQYVASTRSRVDLRALFTDRPSLQITRR